MRILGSGCLLFVFLCASVHAGTIVNGGFDTGNLDGWTVFTVADADNSQATGTNGTCLSGLPCPIVTPFDTTGTGDSNAAQFSVGRGGLAEWGGGGISQYIYLSPGTLDLSVDCAVYDPEAPNIPYDFAILFNGVTLNSFYLEPTAIEIATGTLTASTTISVAGSYQVAVEITRWAPPSDSISQYLDNVTASGTATDTASPEPSTWGLAIAGLALIAGCGRWPAFARKTQA